MGSAFYIPQVVQKIVQRGVCIDGDHLQINDVIAVARFGALVTIDESVRSKVENSKNYIERAVKLTTDPDIPDEDKKEWLIYGVTTGFGNMKRFPIDSVEDAQKIQENIIYSHAVGVGENLSSEIVRAMILLRANAFAKGHSGVRYELIELLVALLNRHIHPLVPEQGSVGASGDLCPLAHMSLVLIGRGRARIETIDSNTGYWKPSRIVDGAEALNEIGDTLAAKGISLPFKLWYKEGLALTNGTSTMTAIGVLNYYDAVQTIKHADIASAMSLEAIAGRTRAFDAKVHRVRPQAGQTACAANISRIIRGSELVDKNRDVQNAYSVRCIPQVHGASKDALDYIGKVLTIEINSVTDNPLFFEVDPEVIDGVVNRREYSAGNYHGQPIALAMDFLGIALAEIANISERRTQNLLDANFNYGLPANLTLNPGLNSGLMMLQYTAAALVSENKTLAHPASVDSIPTSSNIEDHVSMGTIAARKARRILENLKNVIAIELICAAQALDYRIGRLDLIPSDIIFREDAKTIGIYLSKEIPADTKIPDQEQTVTILKAQKELKKISVESISDLGEGTRVAYQFIRNRLSAIERDDRQELHHCIRTSREIIREGKMLAEVEKKIGILYES